jgi:Cu-Zn family superoxide dismutase
MRCKQGLAASLFIGGLTLASPAVAIDQASAVLKDGAGKDVGKATLTVNPSGVLVSLDLTGVPTGEHAFHIHAVGKCEAPDFKSAGPHFNPDQTKHGYLSAEGPHAGDMPNLHIPTDGKLKVEILESNVTLSGEAPLLDSDGAALVIHAGADDYKTDPAGNSGDRIACGVITP